MVEKRVVCRGLVGRSEGRDKWVEVGVDGRRVLRRIFRK
jgi:hypothetical protein